MKTKTLTAPSAWASAIVNGDYSSLAAEERGALNTFLAMESVSFSDCLTCEDAGFQKHHDAFKYWPFASDCQNYVFPA